MTGAKAYHFERAEHWRKVLTVPLAAKVQIDARVAAAAADPGLAGARQLAVGDHGEMLVLDSTGHLRSGSAVFAGFTNPLRLCVDGERLWVLDECGPSRTVFLLDRATCHFLERTSWPELVDFAPDGRGGLWLLTANAVLHRGPGDCPAQAVQDLAAPARAIAVTSARFALLDQAGTRLEVVNPATGAVHRIDLSESDPLLRTGAGVSLGASGETFLVTWTSDLSGRQAIGGYLTFDPDGEVLAVGSFDPALRPFALGIDGRDVVFLVDRDGEVAFGRMAGAVRPGSERRMLPTLELSRAGSNWHRADIRATVRGDAILRLRWAASEDRNLQQLIDATQADASRPPSERLAVIDAMLGPLWSKAIDYPGSAILPGTAPVPETFALPFHGERNAFLWVDLQLLSPAGAVLPELVSVRVQHDTEGLMQHLPAIYRDDSDLRQGRRTAFDGSTRPLVDDTMRRLVAVLESTIDGIDRTIAGLAGRLDPATTPLPWLGDLAAMLGLPFHEALEEQQRRALVAAAGLILARRGTRAGLLHLLRALFPNRRIRVRDRTEELMPVTLGGDAFGGSRLPSLLSGPSIRLPRLNARLVLSRTALCPATECTDPLIAPRPQVLVEIPATVRERSRLDTAVAEMIAAMVPAGVTPILRWLPFDAGAQEAGPDTLTILPMDEPLVLGSGQALGGSPLAGNSKIGRPIGDADSGPHRLA